MKLSESIDRFIAEVRTAKAEQTAAAYKSDLRRMSNLSRVDSVLRFDADLCRAYLEYESSHGAKLTTLHRKQSVLRSFARWCLKNRIIAEDPTLNLMRIPRQKTLPRPYSKQEIERLWALPLVGQEKLLRSILFFSGMRVSAIGAIRLGDISDSPPMVRTTGKGQRTQMIHLHPKLAELVKDRVLQLMEEQPRPARFLLSHPDGRQLGRKTIEQITRAWGVAAKVHQCVPHRFRHSFGTTLLEATKNIRIVQEALGHADVSTTMLYTKVRSEDIGEGITKLPDSWGDG